MTLNKLRRSNAVAFVMAALSSLAIHPAHDNTQARRSDQIKDDLLDYSDDNIGKPKGIDLKEKKMTLPLIYALNNSTWLEKRKIINIVKNHNDDPKKVAEVIAFVIQKGGIQYAEKVMHQYKEKALSQLQSVADSPSKQSLIQLVNYSIERKK